MLSSRLANVARPAASAITRLAVVSPRSSSSSFHSSPHPAMSDSVGPVETSIKSKLESALSPVVLEITNDSSKHRHHAPMRAVGGGSGETHFTVQVVSDKFDGLRVIQRHRLVNDALKEEFAAGLHALAIKAKSPAEYEAAGGSI
ncbi:hypothetical protein JCM10212_006127 [Sporobolomyces blumeae]